MASHGEEMSLQARVMELIDDEHGGLIGGVLNLAKEIVLKPVRPFVSRPARRTYLTTILLFAASSVLLVFAITAYTLFYWSYIPRVGFQRTIHLQFDHVFHHAITPPRPAHPYPYGTISLASDMIASQAYDITIELILPRTRDNRQAGNFMLEVSLYTSDPGIPSVVGANISPLANSRRTALFPYRSFVLDTLHRMAELPLYIFNIRSESTVIRVPVFESVVFSRASRNRGGIPKYLQLEIQSAGSMQIDGARAHIRAKFSGLRWIMYNHRIIATLMGVSTFWVTEVIFAVLAWILLSGSKETKVEESTSKVKKEDGDAEAKTKEEGEEDDANFVLSDTERTFPTLRGQPPLRYTSSGANVKTDGDEEAVLIQEPLSKGGDADDEEDEEDVDFFDSGIGTSLDSAGPSRRDSMRRRRGRTGRNDDAP